MTAKEKLFKKILVVDDDYASRYLAQLELIEMGVAQQVVTLPSARAALDYLQEHCLNKQAVGSECPDVILLDLNMPAMDGFDFLKSLRELDPHNPLPITIVALTTSLSPKDQERLREYGIRTLLEKPISREKIASLVTHSE